MERWDDLCKSPQFTCLLELVSGVRAAKERCGFSLSFFSLVRSVIAAWVSSRGCQCAVLSGSLELGACVQPGLLCGSYWLEEFMPEFPHCCLSLWDGQEGTAVTSQKSMLRHGVLGHDTKETHR